MIIIITLSTRFFHQSTKLLDSLPICLITIKIKKKMLSIEALSKTLLTIKIYL